MLDPIMAFARGIVLALGILLVSLLFFSFMAWAMVRPVESLEVWIWDGSVQFEVLQWPAFGSRIYIDTADSPSSRPIFDALLPRTGVADSGSTTLHLPLWLLAVICLAWPVTSLLVARRRRNGRGFEVEARPGAAVPPPES